MCIRDRSKTFLKLTTTALFIPRANTSKFIHFYKFYVLKSVLMNQRFNGKLNLFELKVVKRVTFKIL